MAQQLQFSTQVHWPPYFLITWSPYTAARPIIIPYTCDKSLSIVSNIIALIPQINFTVIQCLLNHTSFCKFYSFRYYAHDFPVRAFPKWAQTLQNTSFCNLYRRYIHHASRMKVFLDLFKLLLKFIESILYLYFRCIPSHLWPVMAAETWPNERNHRFYLIGKSENQRMVSLLFPLSFSHHKQDPVFSICIVSQTGSLVHFQ